MYTLLRQSAFRRLLLSIPLFTLSVLAFIIFQPISASAASGEWVDAATIKIGDATYTDKELFDSMDYFLGGTDNCTSVIKGFNADYGESKTDYSKATLIKKTKDPLNGKCSSQDEPITLGSTDNAKILFHWVDEGTLEYVLGGLFKELEGRPNVFAEETDSDCKSDVAVQGPNDGLFTQRFPNFDCIGPTFPVKLGSPGNITKPPDTGTPRGIGEGQGANPSCESEGGEGSWILCPTLRIASNFIRALDEQINDVLQVPNKYFEGKSGENLHASWTRLRNIAYIILVPIMLVMVLGTAIGFSAIDAYTVKRALPRLVAATLFIALSYQITTFGIKFINDVGKGMLGLLTSSFATEGEITLASLFDPGVISGGLFTAAAVGTTLLALGAIPIVLLYAVSVGLILFIAFLGLAFRQMLLLALVLMAPLAILAWIFPGNDKLWKLWWGAFSKLLFLYPLVMILIGGGRVFAKVVQEASGSGFLETILILTAYVGPYFFIPATFKIAGGLFATITGMANDRSRGLFDRNKKLRQQLYGKKWEDMKGGNYYRGTGALSRFGSRTLQTAALGAKGNLSRAKLRDARAGTTFDTASKMMQEDTDFARMKDVDHMLEAARTQTTRQGIENHIRQHGLYSDEADLQQQVATVQRVQKKYGIDSVRTASTMQLGATGTGYGNVGDVLDAINQTAGGDRALANRMLGTMRGLATGSRRFDLGGAGMVPMMQELNNIHTAAGTPGYAQAVAAANAHLTNAAYEVNGAGAIIGGRVQAVDQFMPVVQGRIDHAAEGVRLAHASGNQQAIEVSERALKQELASSAALLDVAGQVSPENAKRLADTLMNYEYTNAGGTQVRVSEAVNNLRTDDEFGQMRREYGVTQAQQAQQLQQQAQAAAAAAARPGAPGGGIPGIGGIPGGPNLPGIPSDRRLKRNIKWLEKTENGMDIYRFQYLWSNTEYIGVMAQDLLKTHPEAVLIGSNGYYLVDYALLGMKMLTYSEWQAQEIKQKTY